jgi:FkbM family methyltransferase
MTTLQQLKRMLAYLIYKTCNIGMSFKMGSAKIKLYPQSKLEFHRIRMLSKGQFTEAKFLQEFINECTVGRTVYDIGAHIGTFTLFAAQSVGPEGRVYSFEMDPRNYKSLTVNVKRNRMANVIAINKAVSSGGGIAHYTRPTDESGDGAPSITRDAEANNTAEMTSIDQLIARNEVQAPDVVKIDVEGHESEVVQGMEKTLSSNDVTLFIEVHDNLLKRNGTSAELFILYVQNQNYYIYADFTSAGRAERHLVFKRRQRG